MKKGTLYDRSRDINVPRLAAIIMLIIIGAVIGSLIGVGVEGNEDWLWDYMNNSPQQFFRKNAILNLIIVVVVFMGGFTSVGIIPIAVGVISKGIIASIPVTACIKLYSISGYFIAAENGMVSNIITTTAITAIAMQSLEMSVLIRNGTKDKYADKLYALYFCACAATIIFASAVDGFLV